MYLSLFELDALFWHSIKNHLTQPGHCLAQRARTKPQHSAGRPERPANPAYPPAKSPHSGIPSADLPFSKRSYKTCGPDIAEIPVFREFPRFPEIRLSQTKNFYTIFSLFALPRIKIPLPDPGPQKSSPLLSLFCPAGGRDFSFFKMSINSPAERPISQAAIRAAGSAPNPAAPAGSVDCLTGKVPATAEAALCFPKLPQPKALPTKARRRRSKNDCPIPFPPPKPRPERSSAWPA